MKNHGILTISSILCLLLSWTSHAQTNIVYYGSESNTLGVVFADTNLSISVQSAITDDLNLCLRDWGRGSELSLNDGADDEAGIIGYLERPSRNPFWLEDIEFPEGVVSNSTGGIALYISQELSNKYTNLLAFAAANSNIIASAYSFVEFVSSTNFAAIAVDDILDYLIEKRSTPAELRDHAAEIIVQLRHQTYYPPSILGFKYSHIGPSATNLWLAIPCSSPAGGDWLEWSSYPAIWHDGKWKFCFWDAAP